MCARKLILYDRSGWDIRFSIRLRHPIKFIYLLRRLRLILLCGILRRPGCSRPNLVILNGLAHQIELILWNKGSQIESENGYRVLRLPQRLKSTCGKLCMEMFLLTSVSYLGLWMWSLQGSVSVERWWNLRIMALEIVLIHMIVGKVAFWRLILDATMEEQAL